MVTASAATADTLTEITLPNNAIEFDARSGLLYASVPGRAGAIGNTITRIDPATGLIGGSVNIGSEPGPLALTDDGQFLYVGLTGAASIRRYHTVTHVAGLQWPTSKSSFGSPLTVKRLAAVARHPQRVAAIEGDQYSYWGSLEVYDNGVALPRLPGSGSLEQVMTALSPARLYGVTSSSVVPVEVRDRVTLLLGQSFGTTDQMAYQRGLGVSTLGQVFDPEGSELLGTCAALPQYATTAVCPDLPSGRIFFLSTEFNQGVTLRAFDARTYTLVGSSTFPGVAQAPTDLVRWGTDGLAFRTAEKVYLVHTSLLPQTNPTVNLSIASTGLPAEIPAGEAVTFNLTVTNNGVDTATNVTLVDTLPNQGSMIYATVSEGKVVSAGGVVTARFGDLLPGASATVTVEARFGVTGSAEHYARVTAFEIDTDESDDELTGTVAVTPPLLAELNAEWKSLKVVCPPRGLCSYKGKLRLQNHGGQDARNFRIRYYLSSSPVRDPNFNRMLKEVKVTRVPRRRAITVNVKLKGPLSGLHYLIAEIDQADVVPEANEMDNSAVSPRFGD